LSTDTLIEIEKNRIPKGYRKRQNNAETIWLSLFMDGNEKCKLPSMPPITGLSRIQHFKKKNNMHHNAKMFSYTKNWCDMNREWNMKVKKNWCCYLYQHRKLDGWQDRPWRDSVKPSLRHFQFNRVGLSLGILISSR
jgi:hypothetical protein